MLFDLEFIYDAIIELYMKKHILLLSVLALLISCKVEEESKQDEQPQVMQQADTIADTPQSIVEGCDTIEPVHLYDEVKKGNFLDFVLMNNGSGLLDQSLYRFAGSYCKQCKITVAEDCWFSEDLCGEWLTSRLGEGWDYNEIRLKDFIVYLYYGNNEKYAKMFPDREKTKRQIADYCKKYYLPKNVLDSCMENGLLFDNAALNYKFDDCDVDKWRSKYWRKYVDIEVVNWLPDCSLATDTSMTYFVTYKYKFHKSKRSDGWETTLRTRLTEYANDTYKIKADDPNIYQSFDFE